MSVLAVADFLQRFLKPTLTPECLARFELRPDVVAAARVMVSDRRSDPQIVRLASSLSASEMVLRMMDGRHRKQRGLLVLTDQRVFFRSRKNPGPIAFSLQLADIDLIEGSTRRAVGTVRIASADGPVVVDDILGNQGEVLADQANDVMRGVVHQQRDPLVVLSELRELRDRGEITPAEFEARKSELWDGI